MRADEDVWVVKKHIKIPDPVVQHRQNWEIGANGKVSD